MRPVSGEIPGFPRILEGAGSLSPRLPSMLTWAAVALGSELLTLARRA
ncbi:MAG: hypothetical protein V2J19_06945 [Wenzhouxiangella sp.]|nr:hypothetical protein [Wenzhouxiangella sp.]